jgi:DNA-binding protein YbaB
MYRVHIFSPDDEENINKRTIDAVLTWISNKDRRAHYYSNIYLFEWFFGVIDHQYWLTAWEEDLFMEDSSKRRYFIPNLWSTKNIDALKIIYDNIPKNDVQALHRLITRGPIKVNLERLHIDPTLFTVHNDTEVSEVMITAQRIASERESITTTAEFEELLQNYVSFASLNRRTEAVNKETWRLKIDPSALKNINNEMLELILQLSNDHALFYHDFDLPVIHFLQLYAEQNGLNDDILCSIIVEITFSCTYIVTAPPGEKKLIRVYKKDKPYKKHETDKKDETFVDIELDQRRWYSLINTFNSARDDYGYSSFFPN